MATIETKTYPMYNYGTSKIIVALRDGSVVVEGGTRDCPTAYPFTMSELQQIANISTVIQSGYLRPAKEDAEYIYETLRIRDWKDILTEEDIEYIVLHPTVEGLTKLINIKDTFYFERVYGVFVGLKNVNVPIAANVDRLLRGRYKELQKGKVTTDYIVHEKDLPISDSCLSGGSFEEIDALKDAIANQNKLIEQLQKQLEAKSETTKPEEKKPAPKSIKRKTTTKKTTGA